MHANAEVEVNGKPGAHLEQLNMSDILMEILFPQADLLPMNNVGTYIECVCESVEFEEFYVGIETWLVLYYSNDITHVIIVIGINHMRVLQSLWVFA